MSLASQLLSNAPGQLSTDLDVGRTLFLRRIKAHLKSFGGEIRNVDL